MKTIIDGLNFQPWVSEPYKNGTGIYGKLLIIGESHYLDDEDESSEEEDDLNIAEENISRESQPNEFSSAIVKGYIENKYNINFFRNLGKLFNIEDSCEVWKNVAFANAIQVSMSNSNGQPNPEQIATIAPAFWLLIENLQPEKVIVCSTRMWKEWWKPIDDDIRSSLLSNPLKVNGKHSNVWEYKYSTGKSLAIGIHHPSRGFSFNDWRPIVMEFMKLKL